MKTIFKVALAVFKNKQMLQVREKEQEDVFYTLGGKLEEGESEIGALKREVKEEINCEVDDTSLELLEEFTDIGHDIKGKILNIKLYQGNLIGDPKPTSEIAEIGYFDSKSDPKYLSIMAQRTIFPWLKQHGYIN